MESLGVTEVYIDRMSGKNTYRPELEREYILQRQREGIEIAKGQGKYTGRKPIDPPDLEQVIARWKAREITTAQATKQLEMSRATLYRKAKRSG